MCRAAGFSRVDVIQGAPSPSKPQQSSSGSRRSIIKKLRSCADYALREFGMKQPAKASPTPKSVQRHRLIVHAWK
jgi:hypothetical protein